MLTAKKNLSFEKGVAVFFLVVVVIACFYFVLDGKSQAVLIFDNLERFGAWAPFLFIVIDMLAVVFVVPGVIFTLGAENSYDSRQTTCCLLLILYWKENIFNNRVYSMTCPNYNFRLL